MTKSCIDVTNVNILQAGKVVSIAISIQTMKGADLNVKILFIFQHQRVPFIHTLNINIDK